MMYEATWKAVILEVDDLAIDAYVCFKQLPATGEEQVFIAGENDWHDEDDEVPTPAAQVGMTDCMTRGDLVQIVANARAQDPAIAEDVLRQAVRFYFDNDAFLDLGSKTSGSSA